jgi:cell division protein FtsQ
MIKKSIILKVLNILLWICIGSGLSFLLVSAIVKEKAAVCKHIEITFLDEKLINMIEENEVYNSLWPAQLKESPIGRSIASFNLFELEKQLGKNPWIEKADIYFDNQQNLHVDIKQKNPVARVFTPDGNSFYLDNKYGLLPLKTTDHIVLPVFINFYINPLGMNKADSALIERVVSLSTYISSDPFWLAQLESVYIRPDNSFELTPQVGEHTIDLGQRNDWEPMFNKLKLLYKKFNTEKSWARYSVINLQYKDQIVCERSGVQMITADSTLLKTTPTDSISKVQSILKTSIIKNINPSKK